MEKVVKLVAHGFFFGYLIFGPGLTGSMEADIVFSFFFMLMVDRDPYNRDK